MVLKPDLPSITMEITLNTSGIPINRMAESRVFVSVARFEFVTKGTNKGQTQPSTKKNSPKRKRHPDKLSCFNSCFSVIFIGFDNANYYVPFAFVYY